MASIPQLGRRLEAARTALSTVLSLSGAETLHKEILTLSELFDAASRKIDQIDPLTGAPRFGPATIERLVTLLALLSEVQIESADRLAVLQKEAEEQMKLKEQEAQLAAEALKATAASTMSIQISSSAAEFIPPEDPAVAERARQLRQRRAEESERRKLEWDQYKAILSGYITQLQEAACSPGALSKALETLSLGARRTILTIVENVIARPDEQRLRRLRPQHPQLLADVTSHCGGLQALLALGFMLKVDVWPDILREAPPAMQRELSVEALLQTPATLLLTMGEPDPSTTAGLRAWTEWFDALKANQNTISALVIGGVR